MRKIALKSYNAHQEIYKRSCPIESFFGTTKGIMASYLEERIEKMAFHVVFAQLALWNIGNILFVLFLVKVGKEFSNSLSKDKKIVTGSRKNVMTLNIYPDKRFHPVCHCSRG